MTFIFNTWIESIQVKSLLKSDLIGGSLLLNSISKRLLSIWQSLGLQAKLMVSFLSVFLVTITVIGTLFYMNTIQENKRQTLSLTNNTIAQITQNIDFYVEDMERLSLDIFGDPLVQRVLRNPNGKGLEHQQDIYDLNYYLANLSSPWPEIQGIYIFSKAGPIYYVNNENGPKIGYRLSEEPWYSSVKTNKEPPIFLWPTGPETTVFHSNTQVFSLVRSINDKITNRLLGFLKMDLNIEIMKDILVSPAESNSNLHTLIIDQSGNVIYDTTGKLTKQKLDFSIPNLYSMDQSSGELQIHGQKFLYSFLKSSVTNWTTLALIPTNSMIYKLNQIRNLTLLLVLISIVIISIITYLISTRITHPMRQVIHVMRQVESGNMRVRFKETTYQNEIGLLSNVFNKMLDSLQHLMQQVYESEIREKDAKLLALQAQINPHFLFNTLNIIRAIGRRKGISEVSEMAESLAELFRYSMKDWGTPVPLKEELNHVQNYMSIQQIRFRDRFKFDCNVPEHLAHMKVVKLSIQPLVENAVIHGLEGKKSDGVVEITAESIQGILEIKVIDNGIGIDEDTLTAIRTALQESEIYKNTPTANLGIGIINIHRRIRLMYGEEYGLFIESSPGAGTMVGIKLPCLSDV